MTAPLTPSRPGSPESPDRTPRASSPRRQEKSPAAGVSAEDLYDIGEFFAARQAVSLSGAQQSPSARARAHGLAALCELERLNDDAQARARALIDSGEALGAEFDTDDWLKTARAALCLASGLPGDRGEALRQLWALVGAGSANPYVALCLYGALANSAEFERAPGVLLAQVQKKTRPALEMAVVAGVQVGLIAGEHTRRPKVLSADDLLASPYYAALSEILAALPSALPDSGVLDEPARRALQPLVGRAQNIVDRYPESFKAQATLLELQAWLGARPEQFEPAYLALLRVKPGAPEIDRIRAVYTGATMKALVPQAGRARSPEVQTLLLNAETFVAQGRLVAAERALNLIESRGLTAVLPPGVPFLRAQIAMQREAFEPALNHLITYTQVAPLSPDTEMVTFLKMKCLAALGRYGEALALLPSIDESAPIFAQAVSLAARAKQDLDLTGTGLAYALSSADVHKIAKVPQDVTDLCNLTHQLETNPDSTTLLKARAAVHVRMKEDRLALRDLGQAHKILMRLGRADLDGEKLHAQILLSYSPWRQVYEYAIDALRTFVWRHHNQQHLDEVTPWAEANLPVPSVRPPLTRWQPSSVHPNAKKGPLPLAIHPLLEGVEHLRAEMVAHVDRLLDDETPRGRPEVVVISREEAHRAIARELDLFDFQARIMGRLQGVYYLAGVDRVVIIRETVENYTPDQLKREIATALVEAAIGAAAAREAGRGNLRPRAFSRQADLLYTRCQPAEYSLRRACAAVRRATALCLTEAAMGPRTQRGSFTAWLSRCFWRPLAKVFLPSLLRNHEDAEALKKRVAHVQAYDDGLLGRIISRPELAELLVGQKDHFEFYRVPPDEYEQLAKDVRLLEQLVPRIQAASTHLHGQPGAQ